MDNNLILNNPLTPYLQQATVNEGLLCVVSDFEEAKRKQTPKDSKRVFFKDDLKYLYAKITDGEGKVTMATFELRQVPNPVPVTEADLSAKLKVFDDRLQNIENMLKSFAAKGGENNEPV